tara:strand:+ start:213 stop:533 length:321 start_codon:yes stop_codon:yes gene_type:complete
MKSFLLPLLAATALPTAVEANWFGKYGSYMEADNACSNWQKKGATYKFKKGRERDYTKPPCDDLLDFSCYKDVIIENPLRDCFHEEKTRQILGINEDRKIKKRFKY